MRILVVNGPNLALLGTREPRIYGTETLESILGRLEAAAAARGVRLETFQSDVEGELVGAIGAARGRCDGIIINPAAYTHTSVALRDALAAAGIPAVEVHLSHVQAREPFRQTSLTAPACIGQISGFGAAGYLLALDGLLNFLENHPGKG